MQYYVAVITHRFQSAAMELALYQVEARTPAVAAETAFATYFGHAPTVEDNLRDPSRTSSAGRIPLARPGHVSAAPQEGVAAESDPALAAQFTFDHYGQMTGTILVRKEPYKAEPIWT